MSPKPVGVRAAGVLPYRVCDGDLEVAVVHRPAYDDWSWPKGKLDRGEDWAAAAARETAEETGLSVRLGMPLPTAKYRLNNGTGPRKTVRYWAGTIVGGEGRLEHEVDAVDWLAPGEARERLTYPWDRTQLKALVDLHTGGLLDTWPLLIVRHAHAVPRGSWDGDDPDRPLSSPGRRRSANLVSLLEAYAPTRVLSSPSVRCVDTLTPYTASGGLDLVTRKGLSEEGFEKSPEKVTKHLRRLLARGEPAALCTHGPLLPRIVDEVWRRSSPQLGHRKKRMLGRLVDVAMDKGEILACTMRGTGDNAQVVAVERHRP